MCDEGGLVVTRNVTVREVVALFLHILDHNLKNRTVKNVFAHSRETISRQFHFVLKVILKISKKYIKQDHTVLHEGDDRWKWFKGELGALDGTHVPLAIPIEDQDRYPNRKGGHFTSVLSACDANLKFIYVLIGWELGGIHIRFLSVA